MWGEQKGEERMQKVRKKSVEGKVDSDEDEAYEMSWLKVCVTDYQ